MKDFLKYLVWFLLGGLFLVGASGIILFFILTTFPFPGVPPILAQLVFGLLVIAIIYSFIFGVMLIVAPVCEELEQKKLRKNLLNGYEKI